MIKAVIIGFSHMHVNEIAMYMKEQPNFELVGAAPVASKTEKIPPMRYTHDWNMENIRSNYCENIYDDYKKMLDELKPEIAFILTENCQKPEVVEECAKRGINVSIEKPIAVSLEEADRIKASVDKYGIKAVVNWPVAWNPIAHKLRSIIDSGIVGKPIKMRYINGHTGPLGKGARHRGVDADAEVMTDEMRGKTWWHQDKFGGGVLLDIGCYGCFYTRWMLDGGAKSVVSVGANLNTDFGDTEDNFAAIVKFSDRISVLEGTWTTPRSLIPAGPMIICTDGVIVCEGPAENPGEVKAYDIFGTELETKEYTHPQSYKNMMWHYADHSVNGTELFDMITLDTNMEVMAILNAIVKSARGGKEAGVVAE